MTIKAENLRIGQKVWLSNNEVEIIGLNKYYVQLQFENKDQGWVNLNSISLSNKKDNEMNNTTLIQLSERRINVNE